MRTLDELRHEERVSNWCESIIAIVGITGCIVLIVWLLYVAIHGPTINPAAEEAESAFCRNAGFERSHWVDMNRERDLFFCVDKKGGMTMFIPPECNRLNTSACEKKLEPEKP